jgi:hypothetical protein
MNITPIRTTAGIQSSTGMSAFGHTFRACTGAATLRVRAFDLAQGDVAVKPAAAARQGWVQETSAWRPPIV